MGLITQKKTTTTADLSTGEIKEVETMKVINFKTSKYLKFLFYYNDCVCELSTSLSLLHFLNRLCFHMDLQNEIDLHPKIKKILLKELNIKDRLYFDRLNELQEQKLIKKIDDYSYMINPDYCIKDSMNRQYYLSNKWHSFDETKVKKRHCNFIKKVTA